MDAASFIKRFVTAGICLGFLVSVTLASGDEPCSAGCKAKCDTCKAAEASAAKCCSEKQAATVAECDTHARSENTCSGTTCAHYACHGGECSEGSAVTATKGKTITVKAVTLACDACNSKGECCESSAKTKTVTVTCCDACDATQKSDASIATDVASGQSTTRKVTIHKLVGDLLSGKAKVSAQLSVNGSHPHLKVGHVVVCGHKICTGNKCIEVEDKPIVGEPCDESSATPSDESEEQIIVVPAAPPVPPVTHFAQFIPEVDEDAPPDVAVRQSLRNATVALPAAKVVELLVAQTELSTRLEMTEQLMNEREMHHQQVQMLAERNAQLATQVALMEARQHYSEALTASLLERDEFLARQVAASKTANTSSTTESHASDRPVADQQNVLNTIQEDLTNIRRQIAILKRQQPVPFAASYVGVATEVGSNRDYPIKRDYPWNHSYVTPYVPTIQLPVANDLSGEMKSQTCENPSEKTVK